MENGILNENDIDVPVEMINFAKERIREYRLTDIYVMGIAEVIDEYKIIECDCFNGTGFYQHNIEKIIGAINDFFNEV